MPIMLLFYKMKLLISILGTLSLVGYVSSNQQQFELFETIQKAPAELEFDHPPQELDALKDACTYAVDNSYYQLSKLRDDK